jgi:hypothetical protein
VLNPSVSYIRTSSVMTPVVFDQAGNQAPGRSAVTSTTTPTSAATRTSLAVAAKTVLQVAQTLHSNGARQQAVNLVVDNACSRWQCSCQRLSDITGISHNQRSWGNSSSEQKAWWLQHKCIAIPTVQGPRRQPALTGVAKSVGSVCYLILTTVRAADLDAWIAVQKTWPTTVAATSRVYRVLAQPGSKDLGIDGKEAINGSGSVDHSQGIIKLQLRESYDSLAIKTLAMLRYLSRSFTSDGWDRRCAWFVKLDMDSWINAPLLESWLGCLSPDRPLYTGFVQPRHDFCFGGFYLLSREVVRSVDGWMDLFVATYKHTFGFKNPFEGGEDRAVAGLCNANGVPPQKIAFEENYAFGGRSSHGANTFMSWQSDQQRVCTLAVHPVKNASLMQEMHTLWQSLTHKLAWTAGRPGICYPSNYSPIGQDNLIMDVIACDKDAHAI